MGYKLWLAVFTRCRFIAFMPVCITFYTSSGLVFLLRRIWDTPDMCKDADENKIIEILCWKILWKKQSSNHIYA
jgi:hypothetical protein